MEQKWLSVIEKIHTDHIRFVEVLHIDGRRFEGEIEDVGKGPSGHHQLVLRDQNGKEIRLYFTAIRNIRY